MPLILSHSLPCVGACGSGTGTGKLPILCWHRVKSCVGRLGSSVTAGRDRLLSGYGLPYSCPSPAAVTCPAHRQYQACGPAEEPTCQSRYAPKDPCCFPSPAHASQPALAPFPELCPNVCHSLLLRHVSCHSSSPQNSTLLVEGCFCPEGTTKFAPGYDVCVKICGMPYFCHPLPTSSVYIQKADPNSIYHDSVNRVCLFSLSRMCGTGQCAQRGRFPLELGEFSLKSQVLGNEWGEVV